MYNTRNSLDFSSCGKVMFSEACVKNSVHGGGGDIHGRGHVWRGDMHGWGHAWQGACVVGGMHGRRTCIAGGMHGRGHAWQEICHCSGWYTSYWNAFLFQFCFSSQVVLPCVWCMVSILDLLSHAHTKYARLCDAKALVYWQLV